jgi:Ca2+-binding RTX toxin-like protein
LEDFDLNNVDGTVVVQTLYFTDIGAVSLASLLPLPDGLVNGTTADDVIHTGTGDDVIQGFGGNDSLNAGTGGDVLIGGAGVDFLRVRGPYYPSPLEGEGGGEGEAAMLIGVAGSPA